MITYKLIIDAKPTATHISNVEGVIVAVIWKYVASDDKGRSAEFQSTNFFRYNSSIEFIPYEEVTDEVIESWLSTQVDFNIIKEDLATKINSIVESIPEEHQEPREKLLP